jgi:hypothetical protein
MRHRGAKIVEEAQRRPRPVGSTFSLLHVLNFFRFVNAPILLQRAKDAAQAGLVRLKAELAGAGWKTEVDHLQNRRLFESRSCNARF